MMKNITAVYLELTRNLKRHFRLIFGICFILLGLYSCFGASEVSRNAGIVQIVVGVVFGIYYFFEKKE